MRSISLLSFVLFLLAALLFAVSGFSVAEPNRAKLVSFGLCAVAAGEAAAYFGH